MLLDSMMEDVDAQWIDVNNDGNLDLVIATGGNEYYGQDEHLKPRVYLNDGKANFKKLENAFGDIFVTQSCIVPFDFNGDGFVDLFVGGRAVPWESPRKTFQAIFPYTFSQQFSQRKNSRPVLFYFC